MPAHKDKLLIIDGNALIHRSFHALPPTMITKKGEMVNAVYGFASVLLKAIREFGPDYVALTLDRAEPTFRHKEYKEYKAQREKAPQDLYDQIGRVRELAAAFSIPVFDKAGFEADDLIGTIAAKVGKKAEKIIVTGDLDTLQLIDEHTKVYTMSRGLSDSVLYDAKTVKSRYGLEPEQMIDFKALRGDPSDNIPGVRGIGEKTATELLRNFKTLDGVYKNLASKKIKPRISGLLKEYEKDAHMSRALATIKQDVNIGFELADARFGDFDQARVVGLLSELEFKSLLPRVHNLINTRPEETKAEREERASDKFTRNRRMFTYRPINNEKGFKAFLTKLKKQRAFTFDTETSSFDPLTSDLLGISFAWKNGEAYYVDIKNGGQKTTKKQETNLFNYKHETGNTKQETRNRKQETNHPWLVKLKPIFEDEKIKKSGHNIKFDIRVVRHAGIEVGGVFFDTMIASYLLNPGSRQHNLDGVTFTELGHEKITKDDLLGKGKERKSFPEVDADKLSLYSCEDADFTHRLAGKLGPQLKEKKLEPLFEKIEMPLVPVLARMEDNGIKIDTGILAAMNKKVAGKIKKLEARIHEQAGTKFNIRSTQQLREILFEKLRIPADEIGRTKTGLSTSADELEKLKNYHPIIKLVQEYRELTKLASTYIDALPKLINPVTGRLHTSFNQTITATGRLSSTEPNLQNIPVRTELGRAIRRAFTAEKGHKLVSIDYSQIELRLAAHMSGDGKMITAFENSADIHTATAAEINRIDPGAVTKELRREAKAINFGILYGQGPHGLARAADIPYARARDFIEQYFIVYKDIKKFIDKSIGSARKKGYAETMFGRRRYLPEINSSVMQVRKAAERMAVNTPLQGTAADMIKAAMIEVQAMLDSAYKNNQAKMILQVHDELLFEARGKIAAKLADQAKKIMENVIKLKVPVIADVKIGNNWGDLHEFKNKT